MGEPFENTLVPLFAQQPFHFRREGAISHHRAASSSGPERLGEKKGEERAVAERAERTSPPGAAESVRTVLEDRLALHDPGDRVEIRWIAEGMDEDQAIDAVALPAQIGEAQPQRDRVGIEKHRPHARLCDRLPHDRMREDRHADARGSGRAQRPKQRELRFATLPGGEDFDVRSTERREPRAAHLRERPCQAPQRDPELLRPVRNLVRRDHRVAPVSGEER